MFEFDPNHSRLNGPHGTLALPANDPASAKLAMLLQGECTRTARTRAAANFGFSKARYYQLRQAVARQGIRALIDKKTGPKGNYRRTPEASKLVIRARFLDPDATAEVIASKLRQDGYLISTRSVQRIINSYGLQKKLHLPFPTSEPKFVDTQRTKETRRLEPTDPRSLERAVRQLLCDKISGHRVGIWLLMAEHLRLGSWDLLRYWSGRDTPAVEPRLALQLVHEAALCLTGQRQKRTFSQQGFEVANGLPFVASDWAIHDLLDAHSVAEAQAVQIMLGKLRTALGHFPAQVLAIDPHRIPSYSKRQMVRRKKDPHAPATKQLQTFFVLDADSQQPIALSIGSSSRTVTQATPKLLKMAEQILRPAERRVLVLCDSEHYALDLLAEVPRRLPFDLLVPMPLRKETMAELNALPNEAFTRHWIGYATHCRDYLPKTADPTQPPYWQMIQRTGERAGDYELNAFLCTAREAAVEEPLQQYPKRWHCEEFFNANQALGWNRAGTHNLNVRYGQMTMALIAQAVIAMLRERLGRPFAGWNAQHLAKDFFGGLEGDIRLHNDTIVVTYYNAGEAEETLARHYTNLPQKLSAEGVDPRVPWLYDYKLDFRFK